LPGQCRCLPPAGALGPVHGRARDRNADRNRYPPDRHQARCGPFPDGRFDFLNRPDDWYQRRAAACLYAALVADASLDLIGSKERVLIEGRFAEAEVFVRALAALRPGTAIFTANAHNDVSFGALRLIDPALTPAGELVRVTPLEQDLGPYRARWAAHVKALAA
jgi:hypothetical protein